MLNRSGWSGPAFCCGPYCPLLADGGGVWVTAAAKKARSRRSVMLVGGPGRHGRADVDVDERDCRVTAGPCGVQVSVEDASARVIRGGPLHPQVHSDRLRRHAATSNDDFLWGGRARLPGICVEVGGDACAHRVGFLVLPAGAPRYSPHPPDPNCCQGTNAGGRRSWAPETPPAAAGSGDDHRRHRVAASSSTRWRELARRKATEPGRRTMVRCSLISR